MAVERGTQRRPHRRRALVTLLSVGLIRCSAQTPSAPTDRVTPSNLSVSLNGQAASADAIDGFCGIGLVLRAELRNPGSTPLHVTRLAIQLEPDLPSTCRAHDPGIDPALDLTIPPGGSRVLRTIDIAGSLCRPPTGAAGCVWTARVEAATDSGDMSATARLAGRRSVDGPAPVIDWPRDGASLSGVVPVHASPVEGCGCGVAGSHVWLFSSEGRLVSGSTSLQFGPWLLDTRGLENGDYVLQSSQDCCGALGGSVRVAIRN
jgi:hypothetical protein